VLRLRALLQLAFVAYGKLVAAFGTAAGQHFAAVGRLHALAETMYAFAATVVRLKSTFHSFNSFSFLMKCGPGEQPCFSLFAGVFAGHHACRRPQAG